MLSDVDDELELLLVDDDVKLLRKSASVSSVELLELPVGGGGGGPCIFCDFD